MKKYCLIIISLLALSSCKKWLDVKPQSEIAKDVLFETEEGFQEALNGVYTRCIKKDIYGSELTFGFPDVLAQNYTINSFTGSSSYRQTALYNYKDRDFISRKDEVWKGLYSAIVNANLILENIDQKKNIFSGNNYAIIKGEALALRGYLHFDVFRLFGSAYFTGSIMQGIPYVTIYTNKATAMSTADEVLTKTLEDLNAAKAILAPADSILSKFYKVGYPFNELDAGNNPADAGTETEGNSLFTQNRRHRMNYYAVCGELARVYLYKGDKTNALANAKEVIDSKKFHWTKQSYFVNPDNKKIDRILYNELVFGWYIPKSLEDLQNRFERGASSFYTQTSSLQTIYETSGVGGEDLRFKQWFQYGSTPTETNLVKYKRNIVAKEDDPESNLHPLMAPAIRLSEMYYIAAECSYDVNPTAALAYFDEVRFNRGIGSQLNVPNKAAFMDELVKEARKEWFGEGQLFYMYKRLNKAIVGQTGALIPASKAIFDMPLPNDEIEFGGR